MSVDKIDHWRRLPASLSELMSFVDNVTACDCKARGFAQKTMVHIGAGGSKKHNPLHELSKKAKSLPWSVIAFEPIEVFNEEIKRDYDGVGNLQIVNFAVSNKTKTKSFFTISSEVCEKNNLQDFFQYLSTFHRSNALFGNSLDVETSLKVQKLRNCIETSCLDLIDAMSAVEFEQIDVLRINTQGHDWQVLKQLDLSERKTRPFCISSHVARLNRVDREELFSWLRCNGYSWRIYNNDIVAVDSHIVWQYWEQNGNTKRSPCLDLCQQTVLRNCGNARVVCITPQNLTCFIEEGLPAPVWALKKIAQRADYIRVRAVAAHGGMWMDTDTILVRPLTPIWNRIDREPIDLVGFNTSEIWDGRNLCNGFFGAPKQSNFMRVFFEQIVQTLQCVEQDPSLPEADWVLFGARIMSKISFYQIFYPRIALLSESGQLLDCIENSFDQFVSENVFDHLLNDEKITIIPLFHTYNQMRNVSSETIKNPKSTLEKFLKKALFEDWSCSNN